MKSVSWRRASIVSATLVCVTALGLGGSAAIGADLPDDQPDLSTIDISNEPVESDDILDTLMMLQDAGINEVDSPFKGLTVVENRGDHLVVHIAQDAAESEAVTKAVEEVEAVTPATVMIEYLKFTPGHGNDLAGRLANPMDPLNVELGLASVTGTAFDQLSGTITVDVTDPSFTDPKTLVIEGVPVTIATSKNTWTPAQR